MDINESTITLEEWWLLLVNGQWSSRELHSSCLVLTNSSFFFILARSYHNYSNGSYFSPHHGDRCNWPFSLYSCRSRRKEIYVVTWHNCASAFVHAVCHHFISATLYIYITLGHDTMAICFFCVTWLLKHAFTISSLFPLFCPSVCLSACLYLNIILVMRQRLRLVLVPFIFVLTTSNFFKCRHSEMWVEYSKVEVKLTFTCVISTYKYIHTYKCMHMKWSQIKFKKVCFVKLDRHIECRFFK